MIRSNLDKIIHKVSIRNNLRDIEGKNIINSVYEYMTDVIKEADHSEEEIETNFYHRHLGIFYFRRDVYNRVIEAVKKKEERNKQKEINKNKENE